MRRLTRLSIIRNKANEDEHLHAKLFLGQRQRDISKLPRSSTVINGPKEPLYSQFLYYTMHIPFWKLVIMPLFLIVIVGFALGGVSSALKCHDTVHESGKKLGIVAYAMFSFGDLIGNHYVTKDTVENQACLFMISAAGYIGLVFQSVLFALVVHRILHPPKGQFIFANKCLFHTRDGVPTLSFHICHKHGRVVRAIEYTAYAHFKRHTAEGEDFVTTEPIHLVGPPICTLPGIVTHIIDENSPFRGVDMKTTKNMHIFVQAIGIDVACGWTVIARAWYDCDDLRFGGLWEDTALKHSLLLDQEQLVAMREQYRGREHEMPSYAETMNKTRWIRPAFDYSKFHNIVFPNGGNGDV